MWDVIPVSLPTGVVNTLTSSVNSASINVFIPVEWPEFLLVLTEPLLISIGECLTIEFVSELLPNPYQQIFYVGD
jgi:hypothetical protein